MSDLPKRNGWTIAERVGDPSPDATQRLLNRATWDTLDAVRAIPRFTVTRLDAAAWRAGLTVGALEESEEEKKGTTALPLELTVATKGEPAIWRAWPSVRSAPRTPDAVPPRCGCR
jgi:hypothetical protein